LNTHIKGLDSLRFVAALWVAIAHGAGLPLRELFYDRGSLYRVVAEANGIAFDGVAAVMVFFIVSGFCIHLPFVGADKIEVRRYLLRRYVRIGGPLLVVLVVVHFWTDPAAQAGLEGLWSVYCELAYYTLYPLLFLAIRKLGFRSIIVAATAISTGLILAHWTHLYAWQFGVLTFLTAFPAWLLGCLLADRIARNERAKVTVSIWHWRAGAWLYSIFAMLGVFHSPIRVGYPASMLFFSFYCYFWLQQELQRWRDHPPARWLESAGAWSYSMYLMHMSVLVGFRELNLGVPLLLGWALQFTAVLLVSYTFYIIVERPSHSLARRLGRLNASPPARKTVLV
jgi:peptidoglycan/LPS O-acetylase OafA/YrhL